LQQRRPRLPEDACSCKGLHARGSYRHVRAAFALGQERQAEAIAKAKWVAIQRIERARGRSARRVQAPALSPTRWPSHVGKFTGSLTAAASVDPSPTSLPARTSSSVLSSVLRLQQRSRSPMALMGAAHDDAARRSPCRCVPVWALFAGGMARQ